MVKLLANIWNLGKLCQESLELQLSSFKPLFDKLKVRFIITSYTCIDLMPQPKSDSNKPESNSIATKSRLDRNRVRLTFFVATVNVLPFRQWQRAAVVSMAQDFIDDGNLLNVIRNLLNYCTNA
uniref:Uncharacterized protein n=1 Tax=Glossina palpalis gambiensis TaxID=67801 RepID=A0A1B0ATB1_9MUSC